MYTGQLFFLCVSKVLLDLVIKRVFKCSCIIMEFSKQQIAIKYSLGHLPIVIGTAQQISFGLCQTCASLTYNCFSWW